MEIHSGLPREGPGSNKSTRAAYALMKELPKDAAVLDIGCGPGMQTLELSALTEGPIIAVDTHAPYLDELNRRARAAGVAHRIETRNQSMFELDFPDASFDAIWSEGAIYFMGVENGLRAWRRFLKPRGYVAITELSWLKPRPPEPVRTFWETVYPAMADIETNLGRAHAAQYDIVGHFTLPDDDWWTHYYAPLEARVAALREKYHDDPEALRLLNEEEKEFEMFRAYSAWYGYVFYVMRASASS
ncbi:MAG: class I SAM-dependent methyltransferase [Candidatus Hydrogenedentes bacterium]|nr:class I SAM-dependent methyltransferase [Candidatus Hydrogenedentota bacterium]